MGRMITKAELMNMLDDEEIARVSRAEAEHQLSAGDEYVDLDHIDKGIQKAATGITVGFGSIIPKNAVSPKTWFEIEHALT